MLPLSARRFGNVLLDCIADNTNGAEMRRLAAAVTRGDASAWVANTFEEASAWLSIVAHSHASHSPIVGVDLPNLSYHFLGFRGQAAQYESLSASLYRVPLSQRHTWERTRSIFSQVANLWSDTYCQRQDGSYGYSMDHDGIFAIAQHFGVKTEYLDWSFDPMTALFFAIDGLNVGDSARVILRHFSGIDEPTRSYHVLLPHPCLSRPWRQFGFFDHCLPPEAELDSLTLQILGTDHIRAKLTPATSYWNVVFTVTATALAWADVLRDEIYWDAFGFEHLALTARQLATSDDSPLFDYSRMNSLIERCADIACPLPRPFEVARAAGRPVEMPYRDVLRYLDMACGAYHPTQGFSYFMPALQAIHVGTPYALLDEVARKAADEQDSRARVVAKFLLEFLWQYSRWPEGTNPRDVENLYVPIQAP